MVILLILRELRGNGSRLLRLTKREREKTSEIDVDQQNAVLAGLF